MRHVGKKKTYDARGKRLREQTKEKENKEMGEMDEKPRQRHTDTWTQRYRYAEVLRNRGTEEHENGQN